MDMEYNSCLKQQWMSALISLSDADLYNAFILKLLWGSPMWPRQAAQAMRGFYCSQPHDYTIISVWYTAPESSELTAISLFNALSICGIFLPVIKCHISDLANLGLCWDHWLQLFQEPCDLSAYRERLSLLWAPQKKRAKVFIWKALATFFFSSCIPKHISSRACNL